MFIVDSVDENGVIALISVMRLKRKPSAAGGSSNRRRKAYTFYIEKEQTP